MSLRPQPARWFEVLVMREDLTAALDVLARSRRVELESHGETRAPLLTPEAREMLETFGALEDRFGRYWPTPKAHKPDERTEPQLMLELALSRLQDWAAAARDPVDRLDVLIRQRDDLRLLVALFGDSKGPLPDFEQLSRAGPMLNTCLYQLSTDRWPEALPGGVITHRLVTPEHTFLLAVGLPGEVHELEQQLRMDKGQAVHLPDDTPASATEAAALTQKRLQQAEAEIADVEHTLEVLHKRYDIADAIADAQFVRWYVDNVPELSSTENFAWITGWTSDPDEEALLRLLAQADIKGLLHVSEPPAGFEPPLLLQNPRWIRPFELFTGMLGVPAAAEADPSRVVAIVSPLMFGYMFGDVGHGAVLLVAGLIFSRRLPALRLLIAGGAVSIVFGLLFGSVFTRHDVIEPLWLHPMEHPVLILLVPMIGGAVLLLIGMVLDALQAYWQNKGRFWWETGAGLMLCYVALLGALWVRWLLFVAVTGAVWFILGHALIAPGRRLAAVGSAAIEFVEIIMQLVVNTISFVRVGAFALAHAGLSLAIIGVSEVPASLTGTLIVLILGNALIIGLEGLVVGIQTTRLVLFEFFVRFLRAEGRPFRPMAPAVSPPIGNDRRST